VPFPSVADVGYLGVIPFGVAGLLLLPVTTARLTSLTRTLTDALVVGASLLFVSWSLVLGPLYHKNSGSILAQVLTLAYPVGDIVLATIVAYVAARASGRARGSLMLVGIGLAGLAFADSSYAYLVLRDLYAAGNPIGIGWVTGFCCIALAALRSERTTQVPDPDTVGPPFWAVPYSAVGLALVVTVVRLATGRTVGVFLTANGMVIVILILARNLVTLLENRSLLRSLESTIAALTKSQALLTEAQEIAGVASWERNLDTGTITWLRQTATRSVDSQSGDVPIAYDEAAGRVHPADHGVVRQAIEAAIRDGQPFSFVHRVIGSDGTERVMSSRGRVLPADGAVPGRIVGATHDVTESKKVEERLRDLTKKLSYANKRLETTNGKLEQTNADLEQFASIAAHDLKSPLHTVMGFCDLLMANSPRDDAEKRAVYLDAIAGGARRMEALIDGLLAYCRLGASGIRRTAVDCTALMEDVLVDLHTVILDTNASVTVGDLPIVVADEAQLRQVLQNLVGNAIKFRTAEVAPRISVDAERHGSEWCLSVTDNGIGVDARFRERIFTMFQRLHSQTKYDGTGLGLAICKRVIESHGGRISVTDAPGGGSRFTVSIPDALPDAGPTADTSRRSNSEERADEVWLTNETVKQ
jgi:signal transduction histidine kinase